MSCLEDISCSSRHIVRRYLCPCDLHLPTLNTSHSATQEAMAIHPISVQNKARQSYTFI